MQAGHGARGGVLQGQIAQALDEMHDHLGVGARRENVARLLELPPQPRVVLDDAVVDDGQGPRAVGVRVRVGVGRRTVGRPARVADADVCLYGILHQRALEVHDLARAAADLEPAAVEDGETGRVVPAVFEPLETLDQKWRGVFLTHITDDPAHGRSPLAARGATGSPPECSQ